MADEWRASSVGVEDEDEGVISQEDCWSVIHAYFDENVPKLLICDMCGADYGGVLVACADADCIV
jgi:hypothetical protein